MNDYMKELGWYASMVKRLYPKPQKCWDGKTNSYICRYIANRHGHTNRYMLKLDPACISFYMRWMKWHRVADGEIRWFKDAKDADAYRKQVVERKSKKARKLVKRHNIEIGENMDELELLDGEARPVKPPTRIKRRRTKSSKVNRRLVPTGIP